MLLNVKYIFGNSINNRDISTKYKINSLKVKIYLVFITPDLNIFKTFSLIVLKFLFLICCCNHKDYLLIYKLRQDNESFSEKKFIKF